TGAEYAAQGGNSFASVAGTDQDIAFDKGLVGTFEAVKGHGGGQPERLCRRFAHCGVDEFEIHIRHGFVLAFVVWNLLVTQGKESASQVIDSGPVRGCQACQCEFRRWRETASMPLYPGT